MLVRQICWLTGHRFAIPSINFLSQQIQENEFDHEINTDVKLY